MFSVKWVLSQHSVFRVWTIQVSNLFRYPHFSESMSVFFKEELSRFGILTILSRLYPSFSGSPLILSGLFFRPLILVFLDFLTGSLPFRFPNFFIFSALFGIRLLGACYRFKSFLFFSTPVSPHISNFFNGPLPSLFLLFL